MNVTGLWENVGNAEFKYKRINSETIYDTTLQYWKVDDKWITKREHNKK
jgi:hypothetical protein